MLRLRMPRARTDSGPQGQVAERHDGDGPVGSWHKDGVRNGTELWAATHLDGLWELLQDTPFARSAANRLIINEMVYKMRTRPGALSTLSPYTSWDSLTDRTYSARHLPADPELQERLPPLEVVTELFRRPGDVGRVSSKSTLLFPHFAQWFTDGFLRTDPADVVRNTSTHDIDLSQLYGQKRDITMMLRSLEGGRLKSQIIDGAEYPPYYFGADGSVKPEFANLPITYPADDRKAVALEELDDARRSRLFALGIPRGNIHYGFSMMSTLFLREHNRLAGEMAAAHPDWDDERLFQTARNTLIVLLLKVVVQDYINHITPFHFKLFVEPGIGVGERWYRQNWMSIEFDLLYRWHTLVPAQARVGGVERPLADVLWDTAPVTTHGLAALFDEASRQPATEIGLRNTAGFLLDVETKTVAIGRAAQLASYNDYRQACGYPRLEQFSDVTADPGIAGMLEDAYGSVDDLELYVGLVAEDVRENAALPTLMGTMVGVDAFSQALTNPLLAPGVWGDPTFSEVGMAAIAGTSKLADIVARNVGAGPAGESPLVSFTRQDWRPI